MAQQPSASTPAQSGGLFSSPRKDALENEKFNKMGSVMEETLLKNMQLQVRLIFDPHVAFNFV